MNSIRCITLFIIASTCFTLLAGCAPEPTPTPIPTATAEPTATFTATRAPSATATLTRTSTPAPTNTATSAPKPSATATRTRTRTPILTKPPAGPSPTPSAAQLCASLAKQLAPGIYVMYLYGTPELIWDYDPRQFRVGLCNTIPAPSTPQGKYKIAMTFPPGNSGATQSAPTPVELKSGFNEISVGPWVPGLQNHRAACATREYADTQVLYNDSPDPIFRALTWIDGKDRTTLTIKCGGDYS
ncbi:MAG: hypothetical protein HY868_18800 [Chloroflexi bacterium]|nr:hypothetical protein [Chloroflexota bacterium]